MLITLYNTLQIKGFHTGKKWALISLSLNAMVPCDIWCPVTQSN